MTTPSVPPEPEIPVPELCVPQLYVDADACPVRDEVYRVADRLGLKVHIVSNGSRPILPSRRPNVAMVTVNEGADAADDWIAERITPADICITADIPLAARCLKRGARALAYNGKIWSEANIGNALAGREIARHLREIGATTGGPRPMTVADRSRFLSALDTLVQAAAHAARRPRPTPGPTPPARPRDPEPSV